MPGEDEQGDRRFDGAATEYDTELAEQRFFEEVVRKATPLLLGRLELWIMKCHPWYYTSDFQTSVHRYMAF